MELKNRSNPQLRAGVCSSKIERQSSPSVIVIGAGFAGITAARSLHDAAFQVTVLESRDRIGGRVCTDYTFGFPVDLGASWLHGVCNENPLAPLIGRLGLPLYRTSGDNSVLYDHDLERMTDSVAEILNGLRCYFDKALPLMLLYKQERQQYHQSVTDNVSPSTVYGAEHLLRLFVKLPELLVYVNIEEETLTRLQQKLLDFLKFLQKNQSTLFLSAYEGSKSSDRTMGKRKDD